MSEIATRPAEVIATIRGEEFRQQVKALLPDTVSVDKFERVTVTALLENPDLANLDLASLYRACLKCAADGLLPDGKQAALVPYKGKAQYLPMVGGVRHIAAEYGWMITAHVVASNDQFEHAEEPPELYHRPVRPGEPRGEFVAVYAVARHRDGRKLQRVLYAEEVAKRRKVAQTQNVWTGWTEQMWEKTAVHDIADELPLDPKDRERIMGVVNAMDERDPAEALYGPAARTELEASPDAAPARAMGPAGSAPQEEPQPPGADGAGGDEGDPGGGEREEVREVPTTAPARELTEAEEVAAIEASMFKAPGGKYGPDRDGGALTIGEIHALGDEGVSYLTLMLQRGKTGEYRDAIEAFTRSAMPAEYERTMAARAEA